MEALDITLNSTTIQWVVSEIDETQTYTVQYGTSQSNLEFTAGPISSAVIGAGTYSLPLVNLTQGTTYYVQVVSQFDIYTLTSDVISFTTLEPGLCKSQLLAMC